MEGLIFIDFFLSDLQEIQENKKLYSNIGSYVRWIEPKIKLIREFLKDVIEQQKYKGKVQKDLILRCIDVVYEAENCVAALCVYNRKGYVLFSENVKPMISKILAEINNICGIDIKCSSTIHIGSISAEKVSYDIAVQSNLLLLNELQIQNQVFVGYEDEENIILDLLIKDDPKELQIQNQVFVGYEDEENIILGLLIKDDPKELDVISIIGMPGLGKTTLAKKVFYHETIARKFDIRLFCCVSLEYKKKELLFDMLRQLNKLPQNIDESSGEDLALILKQNLLGKRYLIVVDDVWKTDAWDDLIKHFPMQDKGSRVVLTSRYEKVASYAKRVSDPRPLRPFSKQESWILLQKIIFQNESCPSELIEVGNQIAESCRGLPLVTVLIAGILTKVEKDLLSWNRIAKRIDLQIKNVSDRCIGTIELSYKQLPENLKPCFLYLAAFPEDEEIPVRKLVDFWITERFIPATKEKTLEDVAEDYLMDLISRSLVIIDKTRSRKGVKTIRVHDLIHEFCLTKAQGGFLRWQNRVHLAQSSAYNRRLCAYSSELYMIGAEMDGKMDSTTHSFLVNNLGNRVGNISFQCFEHLRVLHIGCIVDDDTLNSIFSLYNLRYISIRTKATIISSSIVKLKLLETFMVYGHRGEINLSHGIWMLKHLRHLLIQFPTSSLLEMILDQDIDSLESFSTPLLRWDRAEIIKRMCNLRKLKCKFSSYWGYSSNLGMKCNKLPELQHLTKLQSLDIIGTKLRLPCEFNLPITLKKLTLSMFYLPWNEMSTIAMLLPNLEVLKLLTMAFSGKAWEMKDEIFSNLKTLIFDYLDLVEWSANDAAFPKLERLVLKECEKLSEIPSVFAEMYNLQMIEVHRCNNFVEESAWRIKELQYELMGIDNLKVISSK